MTAAATAAASFGVAAAVSVAATPVAIRLARRTDFLDHPRGYRKHPSPTPFLGGAAVLAAFSLAALLVAGASGRLLVPLGCAAALWLIGTIDDRVALAPRWRVLAEAGAGAALYAAGLGWNTVLPSAGDLALTIASVVIAVNAFNLMDNLDGACGAVTAAAAAGVGVLAAIRGDVTTAGLGFALSGACAGFLPSNLARPARIFLGDGGSMPAGLLTAALAMVVAHADKAGRGGLIVGALLAGLPIFDVALVSFSRLRRGATVWTGGRDHLTHRLLLRLHNPRAVAIAVAALQGLLSSLAIASYELGAAGAVWVALGVFLAALVAILLLDMPRWRPAGTLVGAPEDLRAGAPGVEQT